MERPPASVGDALIFMTKAALGVGLVVAIGLAGFWAWLIKQEEKGRQVNAYRMQVAALERVVDERDMTIADLGSKLNQCLAYAVSLREGKASDLRLPVPPPGFVVDHPRPWELPWEESETESNNE